MELVSVRAGVPVNAGLYANPKLSTDAKQHVCAQYSSAAGRENASTKAGPICFRRLDAFLQQQQQHLAKPHLLLQQQGAVVSMVCVEWFNCSSSS